MSHELVAEAAKKSVSVLFLITFPRKGGSITCPISGLVGFSSSFLEPEVYFHPLVFYWSEKVNFISQADLHYRMALAKCYFSGANRLTRTTEVIIRLLMVTRSLWSSNRGSFIFPVSVIVMTKRFHSHMLQSVASVSRVVCGVFLHFGEASGEHRPPEDRCPTWQTKLLCWRHAWGLTSN